MIKLEKSLLFLALFGLLSFAGCTQEHEKEKEEAGKYLATSPLKQDTTITNTYVCQIHSYRNIEIRALEKGYLQDIFVDEGQLVRSGQHMFQIMPMLYQAELHKAEAEAKFAEIEYLNTKALADSNVVSENELALARAKFDKANAELSLAAVHLGFTDIKAPFDGIMDRLQVRQGSLVDEGDLLTTLSDNSKMWVYFNVPEAEYLDYKTKLRKDGLTQVELVMANGMKFPYKGVVETIEAEFNNETGTIPFRATFQNPDGLLRHGETGNILMSVPLKDAIIIPQKATFEMLDKKYVYVVDEQNIVHAREIVIDEEMPQLYVVRSGLTENDRILLEGLRKVRANDKVELEYEAPETAIAHLMVHAE